MWDFVTGNFSPSPSPVLSSGTAPSVSSNSSGNELTRVRQELDDAKRKLKQWEESWQQVKQVHSFMVVLHFFLYLVNMHLQLFFLFTSFIILEPRVFFTIYQENWPWMMFLPFPKWAGSVKEADPLVLNSCVSQCKVTKDTHSLLYLFPLVSTCKHTHKNLLAALAACCAWMTFSHLSSQTRLLTIAVPVHFL